MFLVDVLLVVHLMLGYFSLLIYRNFWEVNLSQQWRPSVDDDDWGDPQENGDGKGIWPDPLEILHWHWPQWSYTLVVQGASCYECVKACYPLCFNGVFALWVPTRPPALAMVLDGSRLAHFAIFFSASLLGIWGEWGVVRGTCSDSSGVP